MTEENNERAATREDIIPRSKDKVTIRRRTLVILGAVGVPSAVLGYFAVVMLTAGTIVNNTDRNQRLLKDR